MILKHANSEGVARENELMMLELVIEAMESILARMTAMLSIRYFIRTITLYTAIYICDEIFRITLTEKEMVTAKHREWCGGDPHSQGTGIFCFCVF